jgi:hypothetical protein
MSGTSNMGGIDLQRQGPDLDRKIPVSPPQSQSESLFIPSIASQQDANEAFRQGWKTIVAAWHAPDKAIGDHAPAGSSWRETGITNSVKEPDAVAASGGQAKTDTVVRVIGDLPPEGASVAKSIAPRSGIVLEISSLRGAAQVGSHHLPAKGRAADSSSHSSKSSRRSGQSLTRQVPDVQSKTTTAPDSEFMISMLGAPQPGIPPVTEDTSQARFSAPEFANLKENSQDQQDVETAGSATRMVPLPVTGRRASGTTSADVKNEEHTAPTTLSPQLSSKRTTQAPDDPGRHVPPQQSTAGVEQAKPSMPNEPSLRVTSSSPTSAALASEAFIKSGEATEATLDPGAQIKGPLTSALKKHSVRRDRAGIGEASLNSPAKAVAAPPIVNVPVSDVSAAAFGQARGVPDLSFSVASMTSSPGLDTPAVTHGKPALVHEPFTAMDAVANDGAARWIMADSHRAEAGFQDPSLGWIGVRAQAGATGIHAAVMPASETAADVLSGHLAGLNAHMANHHEHMNAVTLSTPVIGWNSHDTGRELAQGDGGSPSHRRQQHAQEDSARTTSEPVVQFTDHHLDERAGSELPAFTEGMNSQERHISVVV